MNPIANLIRNQPKAIALQGYHRTLRFDTRDRPVFLRISLFAFIYSTTEIEKYQCFGNCVRIVE
jgi:hypothetical protein